MLKSQQPRSLYDEGVISYVDSSHYICTVRTLGGRTYTGVKWITPIGTNDVSPTPGTSVVLFLGLSSPMILGVKPIISSSDVPSASLGNTGGSALPSPSSTTMYGVSNNSGATSNLLQGDHVTRRGTSLIGLLRSGTILLKAHSLSQILLSKFDQSIRIVARSIETFTDWGDEVLTNYYGRVYRFMGFNTKVLNNQVQNFQFYMVEGDVAAGEYAQAAPFTTPLSGAPVANTTIRKKVLNDNAGHVVMVEELDEVGSLKVTITQAAATQASEIFQQNSEVSSTVSANLATPGTVQASSIVQQDTSIVSTVSPTNAAAGAVVTQQNALWEAAVQGVTLVVTPTSITGTVGSSVISLTSAQSQLSSNGHAVTVTSSGVALS